jgi:2-polyprenyl-6-methoxyphenol hydroxylase-like FAD-dependent oxidoreductase
MPRVKILIVGAGPAGLYLAYLVRRGHPDWEVHIVEQNPPHSTFGFGVVFSDRALEFLRDDDPETCELLSPALQTWSDLVVVHRGAPVRIDGVGFAAIDRLRLLQLLQRRLLSAGVRPEYRRTVASAAELVGYDLVVGADGVNSFVRRSHAERFGTTVAHFQNRFAWYGTTKPFRTLTQTFVEGQAGTFNAHHYRHAADMSTFVIECDPATWERAGFAAMDEEETRAYCGRVFASTLQGHPLVSNKSVWRSFPRVRNERWAAGNVVLIGDAQRTAHFSIGSGTRLAMEDARALARALGERPGDVPGALAGFEASRRAVVEKLVAAADASGQWYERFPEHMGLGPWDLAWSYIQRSGRVDRERLRKVAPAFVAEYEATRGS